MMYVSNPKNVFITSKSMFVCQHSKNYRYKRRTPADNVCDYHYFVIIEILISLCVCLNNHLLINSVDKFKYSIEFRLFRCRSNVAAELRSKRN